MHSTIERVRLPSIGALWNKYYCLTLRELKQEWMDETNIHNEYAYDSVITKEGVMAWHCVMVLTELIKMRGGWQNSINMPQWEDKKRAT
jgi:hypothetical protein